MNYIYKLKKIINNPLLALEVAGGFAILYGLVDLYWSITEKDGLSLINIAMMSIPIVVGFFLFRKNLYVWSGLLLAFSNKIFFAIIMALIFSLGALSYLVGVFKIDGVSRFNGIYFYISIIFYFLLSDEILDYFKMDGYTKWLKIVRGFAFFSACVYGITYGFGYLIM